VRHDSRLSYRDRSLVGGMPPIGSRRRRWFEPVQSFQGGVLDVVDALPGTVLADQIGLVESDACLGQDVVLGAAARTHRELHAGLREAPGATDRKLLAAAIEMVDEAFKIAAALSPGDA